MRAALTLSSLALCLASCIPVPGGQTPKFGAWKIEDPVALENEGETPPSDPKPDRTQVVFRAEDTSVAMLGDAGSAPRLLCRGESSCVVTLPSGAVRLGLWSGTPDAEPEAEFTLEVDERPMQLELKRPKVGITYTGAALTGLGLLSMLVGGLGKEAGGNETRSNTFLYGGMAMAAVGITLGVVYWTSGRGTVAVSPLPASR